MSTIDLPESETAARLEKLGKLRRRMGEIILGKQDVIDSVLVALLAGGSVLLEDVPGVGKTTLAKSLAALFDLDFKRVQCTPDLLPADILGGSVFQPATNEFEFRPGPIFCDLLIADEINRASPRTQSALLEAMAESQVTIDGRRYDLRQPFMVIATQNPVGYEGTYPLPESQLDRFLLRLTMDYPDNDAEVDLLLSTCEREGREVLEAIMHRDDLLALQHAALDVKVDRKVAQYAIAVVAASRNDDRIETGCSPRGAKMWLQAARARALLSRRAFVLPDDLQALAPAALSHRISLRHGIGSADQSAAVIGELLAGVEVPV